MTIRVYFAIDFDEFDELHELLRGIDGYLEKNSIWDHRHGAQFYFKNLKCVPPSLYKYVDKNYDPFAISKQEQYALKEAIREFTVKYVDSIKENQKRSFNGKFSFNAETPEQFLSYMGLRVVNNNNS